jgi:alkylation response protein AidB-like acyl-CoA dehydrogenase
MEFTFDADQEALRDAVRRFVTAESPSAYVRTMFEDERGFTDEVWGAVVDLGWTGLLVPEEHGGLGLGLVDLVVVQEELGRALFPGPWFSSAVLATLAARRLGLDDRLASLSAGATRGTVALDELGHGDPVARVRTRARRSGGRWLLDGLKPVVPDGHTADWALVAARTEHGLGTFLLEAPQGQLVPAWDGTRKLARLALDGRPAEPVGPAGDHTALWQRVGTHYAAWASDVEAEGRALAVAMAKAYVAEAANAICAEAIQIHGGVGFTWDNDCHLHYRRAKQDDLLLGSSGWHRRRVADLVLTPG